MIYLIIKSYLSLILTVASSAFILLAFGLYLIFKPAKKKMNAPMLAIKPQLVNTSQTVAMHQDFDAIAGDDVVATQLDLAKAYIESDRFQAAKKILQDVLKQGSAAQQKEAKHLLSSV